MTTYKFTITGTIHDAPDEQQAINFLRIRLHQGLPPSGEKRVKFDPLVTAEMEIVE